MNARSTRRTCVVLLCSLCLAAPASARQVRTDLVPPLNTDPAITGWFSSHLAAYATSVPHKDRLFLFLHGQGGTGSGASFLLKTAAEEGFHALGVTYPNDWSPFNVCSGDPACPEMLRQEILDGTDRTPLISVTRPDSVENRVIKLLAFLHAKYPGEGWNQFVSAGVIRWDKVVVWGHSQGGGNAGVAARVHALGGVCLSAPAADGGPGNPAPWWNLHLTGSDHYYGFCHTQDQLTTKVAFWDALGMNAFGPVVDVAGTPPPYNGSHELSTSVPPAVSGQYHNSVVIDSVTPKDALGVPVYKQVWREMMLGALAGSATNQWNDVVFATVDTAQGPAQLMMDIYGATAGAGPHPVLVWIHGGGWQSGSHDNVSGVALALRDRGITVASIGYRLSGQAVFPAQIHDCKGAIRFLRANAGTYNIDPERFGVWGSSAGAHLAALVATSGGVAELEGDTGGNLAHSSAVMVAGDYFGPTDLLNMQLDCQAQALGCAFSHDDPSSPESKLIGFDDPGQGIGVLRANFTNPLPPFPQLAELITQVNPITHLDPFDPPVFIGHGLSDTTVPVGQSRRFDAALSSLGVLHAIVEVPGAGHGALGSSTDAAAQDFIAQILLGGANCPADIDHSGFVDFEDYNMFISLFEAGDDAADFDGSGFVDLEDFTAFVARFEFGC